MALCSSQLCLKKNGHNTDILFASEENAVEEIRKIKKQVDKTNKTIGK